MMFGKEFYIVIIYFEKVIFNRLIIDYKFIRNHIILNGKLFKSRCKTIVAIDPVAEAINRCTLLFLSSAIKKTSCRATYQPSTVYITRKT